MRINITLSDKILEVTNKAAKKHYKGNRSKFLGDASLEYSEMLDKRDNKKNRKLERSKK